MAIVVEDGSIVTGANSYITVAEYETWIDLRDSAHTNHGDATAVENDIHRAMDYFESLDFRGYKYSETQALQWPRYGVTVDGFSVDSDEIPAIIKSALYELTYAEEQGYGLLDPVQRATKAEAISGAVSVEYMDNAASDVISPSVAAYLRKLVKPASVQVVRI